MTYDKDLIQEEIQQSILSGPHVVLLGAGATIAAIPNGDKNGKKSSVMDNFIKNLKMEDLMAEVRLRTNSNNLEAIYSELCEHPEYDGIRSKMEQRIYNFFGSLVIPDEPTVYDYLILSLRRKDVIFSFNWDDLLIQAYSRCWNVTKDLPEMFFLHGNVGVSFCMHCHLLQKKSNGKCFCCGKSLAPTQLLYPVKHKDYTASTYLKGVWGKFEEKLQCASVLTIFGYGAPETDIEAYRIMKSAFANKMRWFDHFEVIDIKDTEKVYETWEPFIHATHDHFRHYNSFFDETLMTEFPRRSVEGYVKRNFSGWFGTSDVQVHPCRNFDELCKLFKPLLEKENEEDYSVIPLKHQ